MLLAGLDEATLIVPFLPIHIRSLLSTPQGVGDGCSTSSFALRILFSANVVRNVELSRFLLEQDCGTLLGRMIRRRPLVWDLFTGPYLCAEWNVGQRVRRFIEHVEQLERLGGGFAFDVDESVELTGLQPLGPAYHVVVDKPVWFQREGVLTLNLFRDNMRIFSLSFSLSMQPQGLTALVGGIQGRGVCGIMSEYRHITKLAHGMRPRDLLIELFRMYCRWNQVVDIYAVSDRGRHHNHSYFGAKVMGQLHTSYDEIWLDRGARPTNGSFFQLPIEQQSRDLSLIPSKKRSMYRKRYELLDQLEVLMVAGLRHAHPVRRPEAA